MRQQEQNSKKIPFMRAVMIWMLMICVGLLAASVGITYARYQREYQEGVVFTTRDSDAVCMGIMQEEQFVRVSQLEWRAEDGYSMLNFAIANGTSETDYSDTDQRVTLCMVGSLGLLKDGELPVVSVFYKTQEGSYQNILAEASPIEKGTALYHTYGEGWLYRFYDPFSEDKKEMSWEFSGGAFSCLAMTVKAEGEPSEGLNFLQPLITADPYISQ